MPLGRTKNSFNYSVDEKRVLNFENVVNDDDNIKQDISIDVYGRAEKQEEEQAAAAEDESKEKVTAPSSLLWTGSDTSDERLGGDLTDSGDSTASMESAAQDEAGQYEWQSQCWLCRRLRRMSWTPSLQHEASILGRLWEAAFKAQHDCEPVQDKCAAARTVARVLSEQEAELVTGCQEPSQEQLHTAPQALRCCICSVLKFSSSRRIWSVCSPSSGPAHLVAPASRCCSEETFRRGVQPAVVLSAGTPAWLSEP